MVRRTRDVATTHTPSSSSRRRGNQTRYGASSSHSHQASCCFLCRARECTVLRTDDLWNLGGDEADGLGAGVGAVVRLDAALVRQAVGHASVVSVVAMDDWAVVALGAVRAAHVGRRVAQRAVYILLRA